MANLDQSKWFTEISDRDGSAFSLRINKKLDEKQSPFQKVEMFETTDFGNLMIIDGCTMVTTRENFFYHEMISHPALLAHPNPKNVVIIAPRCRNRNANRYRRSSHANVVKILPRAL